MVSIGLPVVKHQFLSKTIESVLNQTYKDYELLIVNNGGDSKVKEKIEEIASKYLNDNRIQYFNNDKQLPVIKNWNYVLSLAKREYFILLSDDDYFESDFLQILLELTKKHPKTNAFYARVIKVDKNGEPFIMGNTAPEYEDILDFILYQLMGHRTLVLSNFLLRTSELRRINGFFDLPDGWGSDVITWFKMANTGGVVFSNETYFYYRFTPFNISSTMQVRNQYISMAMYYSEVVNLLRNCKMSNSIDILKLELLERELDKWYLRNKAALFVRRLRRLRFIPSFTIPYIALFYDGIAKLLNINTPYKQHAAIK